MTASKARTSSVRKNSLAEIERFITGSVASVQITGIGPNSAQLVFVVKNKRDERTIMVTSPPSYEPQVFTAMAAFVSEAYFSEKEITAGYFVRPDETNYVVEVFAP